MIKRYLLTFMGFFILATGYLFTLLPLLMVRSGLSNQTYLEALAVWGVLVLLSLGPAVSFLLRKIWFFEGTEQSVSLEKLRSTLLEVNKMHGPVRVRKKGKRLIMEWRYDDPAWCERMAAENMSGLYELRLAFNENTRTVTLSDRSRRVDFSLCPIRVKTGFLAMPRLFFGIRPAKEQGLEQYAERRPYDFSFKPGEIKSPLVGTLLSLGWNVQFSLL